MNKSDHDKSLSWRDSVQIHEYTDYTTANADLAKAILALPEDSLARRSHFFHGRYENLYLDADKLPGLRPVLETALSKSATLLQQPVEELKLGFWLNIMHRGDVTTLHCHDDDDELLSAVYYVQAPDNSGLFRLHYAGEVKEIKPVAGRFMFFDPAGLHEVSEHENEIPRISVGINIGPA